MKRSRASNEAVNKLKQNIKKAPHVLGVILKIILIIILVLAVIGGAAFAFVKYYKPVDIRELYQYNSVLYEDVSRRVLTTGNISSEDYAYVFVDASEKVDEVFVKVGDPVGVGDALINYDIKKDISDLERRLASARLNEESAQLSLQSIGLPAEGNELAQYSADVTSAQHNVDQAQSDLTNMDKKIEQQQKKIDQAQRDVDRNSILLQAGDLPLVEYDASETALENAQLAMDELVQSRLSGEDTLQTRLIQFDEAKQRLVNAQDRMGDEATVLKYRQQEIAVQLINQQIEQIQADMAVLTERSTSPVSGYVTAVNVHEGELAVKGVTLIEIAVTSEMLAKADVTEFDAPLLALGQDAEVTTSGLPDAVYNARITKIAAGAIKKEKSSADEVIVPVEFTLDNADDRLRDGYSVDIAVYIDKRERVTAVPIQSVLLEDDDKYLYVLNGNELIKTPVETGFYGDSSVEIVSGADLGTRYAVTPSEVKPLADNWFTRARDWLYEKLSW
ncbi:MAG: efflux RND transporter periplasmic adaptor subunit, partial [Clostridiales bacterium]|nr:efflux RND transporter periplasmic adaptor subunit [Clostridiales bacterium]